MNNISIGYKAKINLKKYFEYDFLKNQIDFFISTYQIETNSTITIVVNDAIIIDDKNFDYKKSKNVYNIIKNRIYERINNKIDLFEQINTIQVLYYQIIIDSENESFKIIEP